MVYVLFTYFCVIGRWRHGLPFDRLDFLGILLERLMVVLLSIWRPEQWGMSQLQSSFLNRLKPVSMGLCVFVLVFVAQFLSYGYLFWEAYVHEQALLRANVSQLAKVASLQVDVDAHESLTDPEQVDSPVYEHLLALLVRFHYSVPDIHYLYTMRVSAEGQEFFVLDTAMDPEVQRMLRALGREVEASGLLEAYDLPDEARLAEVREAMLAGEAYVYKDTYEDSYGSFVSAQAPLFDSEGRYVGYLGIDYELDAFNARMSALKTSGAITILLSLLLSTVLAWIAYKMRLESLEQLEVLSEQEGLLRAAKDRAESAVLAKADLLSVAVHDLKNPLSAIQGLSEMMLMDREQLSQEHQLHLEAIYKASDNLSEVILGILANEGLEHRGVNLEEDVNFSELADSVLSFNLSNARKKGIRFESLLDPDLWLRGDSLRLREAMDNLVSNAIKYSPRSSVVRVQLEVVESGNWAKFSVRDDGVGLSEADQKRLFQKFAKLSTRPTGDESSTGLGLSIVKTIVEMHGGVVGCESREGEGSCFWMKLPLL